MTSVRTADKTSEKPNVYASLLDTGAGIGAGVASDDTTTERNRSIGTREMSTYLTMQGNSPAADYEAMDDY